MVAERQTEHKRATDGENNTDTQTPTKPTKARAMAYFTPHRLQVLRVSTPTFDDYGIARFPDGEEGGEVWEDVGVCRCDEQTQSEITDPNGVLFRPTYHIVAEAKAAQRVRNGDKVRAVRKDGSVRGEGVVKTTKSLNYLNYSEFYL